MFKLDQKGISLPIVLGAAALILANTYYFMLVNKNVNSRNKQAATFVQDQTEESRLISFLSDSNICANDASLTSTAISGSNPAGTNELVRGNFYNKSLVSLSTSITAPLVKLRTQSNGSTGVNFLEINGLYQKGTHRATKYYIEEDRNTAMAVTGREKLKYNFVVEYDIVSAAAAAGQSAFKKKKSTIKIPLVLELVGGIVKTCFARPALTPTASADPYTDASLGDPADSSKVKNVELLERTMEWACRYSALTNATTAEYKKGLNGNDISKCIHVLTNPTATAANVFNGYSSTNGNVTFQQSTLSQAVATAALPCAPGVNQTFATGVLNNSMVGCTSPYNGGCTGGQMMIKSSPTGITCSQVCSATQFFNSTTTSGTVCYDRIQPCPAGQYVKAVSSAGVVTCEAVKFKNVYCAANNFATHVDPTTPSDPLHCTAFSRYRDCGGDNRVFANGFTTAGNDCKGFWF